MRHAFDVYIKDKKCPVFNIEGKEHNGYNDVPKTWWLYNGEAPEGWLPAYNDDKLVPFSKSISRHVWDIQFKQRNTTKVKWDDLRFSNNTHVEMVCNGKPVYSFGTTGGESGLSYAMAKVQYLIVQMGEHPYNFFEPEKERGRKIFWYNLPATVRPGYGTGEICIVPDYTVGIDKAAWWAELRRRESRLNSVDEWSAMEEERSLENEDDGYINWGDALSDAHINWFRS